MGAYLSKSCKITALAILIWCAWVIAAFAQADTTAPRLLSIERLNPADEYITATTVTFRFTFSEDVTEFDLNDVGLGTLPSGFATVVAGFVSSQSASVYDVTASFTTSGDDGSVTLRLRSIATIEDLAGNALTETSATGVSEWYRFDTSAPTAVIGSTLPDPTNASPIEVTFEFSEDVTGFAPTDINVTGGSVSGLTGSTTNYTATIVPSGDGTITVDLPANVVDDLRGNGNAAAAQFIIESDRTAPTATFSALPSVQGLASTQVTLTFSEGVSGLTVGDLVTTNLTASNLQSVDDMTYTFDIVASADGVDRISLPVDVVQDAVGNGNDAAAAVATDAVASRPEVTFAGASDGIDDGRLYEFVVTRPGGGNVSAGPGSGLSEINITNGMVVTSSLTRSTGVFSVLVAPSGGDITIGFPAEFFQDNFSGNLSDAIAPIFIETVDLTPPTPTISFEGYDLEDTFTARVTWDEDVTEFDASDITPVGATLGAFSTISASEYTVEVTAIDLTTAPSINIAADVAEDLAGNGNVAATGSTPAADGTAPTLVITGVPDGFGGPQTVTLTFDWGERVLGFEDSDIAVTGGTLGPITGGPQSWTAQLSVLGTEDVSVTVAANAALDASGTPNAEISSNGAVETDQPTPTISFEGYDLENTFTARVTWDEDVTGFDASDITPVGATLGAFTTVSATEYTVEVTAIDLTTAPSINIAADVAEDLAGNSNIAATGSTPVADGTAPVLDITGVPDGFGGPQTVTVSFNWSERVLGFEDSDIAVTGGTLGPITGGPQSWTAQLSVLGTEDVLVTVAANAVLDASGTPNAEISSNGAVETDQPTPTITYTGYDRIAPFTATITFDEDVTGFVQGDLVAPFAQLSAFTAVSASVYTVTVQSSDLTTLPEVSVPAGVAQDLAGNLNLAAEAATIAPPDGVAPVVTITGVPDGFITTQTATITFDWGEDVIDFHDDDITVTGGTLGPISGGQRTWTATLTVDGDRNVVVSVAEDAALDGSGMSSAAASVVGAFASGEIAEELIREFLAARSVALLAAQPTLSGLLDSGGPSGDISVTRGAGTVQIHTGSEGPIWVALNSNWSDIDGFETAYTNLSFGTHMSLTDETLLGAMLQLDHAVSLEGTSEIEGIGWLIGPYYVVRYGGVDLDARLLWGRTKNDISPIGTYTDTFATERMLAMVNLSGEIETELATLHPLIGWSYVEDRSDAYIDALSNPVASQHVRLNQLEVALDWILPIDTAGTDFVGGAAGLFMVEDGGNGSVEGARGRLDLGLRRQGQGPLGFEVGVYADGLGQSEFEAYGIDLSADWRF